jgi:hypothetical protein
MRSRCGVLGLEVAVEALDPRLVGRSPRPAEVLGDGAQRHELGSTPKSSAGRCQKGGG